MSSGTYISIEFKELINALVVISSMLLVAFTLRDKFTDKNQNIGKVTSFFIYMAFLILTMIVAFVRFDTADLVPSQLIFIAKMLVFFLVLWLLGESRYSILEYISQIIFVFSCLSLVLLTLRYTFGTDFLPMYQVGLVKTSFLSTYFGTDIGFSNVVRNSSIFYEPGLFSVMLSFSFYYFFTKEGFSNRCKLLYISAISTISPVGFLLISLLLIVFYWNRSIILRVLVIVSSAFVVWFVIEFYYIKLDSVSFLYRVEDIKVGLKVFIDNVFFGVGIFNDNLISEHFLNRYGNTRSSSNGLLTLLYQTGIIYSVIYFYFICRSVKCYFSNGYFLALVLITFILIFQPIQYSNLLILLFIMGHFIDDKKKYSSDRA
ncbi:O-antigen ligase family protein [Vibrio splendidus]|uniref:O-antigen ligase family protein n=1 Tax=Vibrio splendidus TaxID=29497 RepID=UPI0013B3C7D7|nr:O-antigen ligase family protein [Vibrio splendidus]